METSGPGLQPIKDANELVTDHPTLRFAIAAFDTWAEAQKALHALNAGGKALNDVSYLAPTTRACRCRDEQWQANSAPVRRNRWRDWLLGRTGC